MDKRSIDPWDRCLRAIQRKVQPQSYETWFAPTRAQCLTAHEAVIEVPNTFFADWLEEHYGWLIQSTIQEQFGWKPALTFTVAKSPVVEQVAIDFANQNTSSVLSSPSPAQAPSAPIASPSILPQAEDHTHSINEPVFPLNPRYRFDNFIVGESNEVSFSAAQAVAEAPGQTPFNPFVLYGGVGLGKTHLLQAIGDYCLRMGTAANVVYVTAEKFFSDYIEGVNNRDTSEFYQIYRNADVLLVDDIQFYVKTEGCQRELIHTFNALYQNDKQIIISSDRPPSHLKGFEDRLISRFQWGLVTDIEAPDLSTRVAILMQKAEEMGASLSHEVALFLAEQIDTNIRELEGALKRLLAFSKLRGFELNIETAQKTLLSRPRKTTPAVSIEGIQKAAADFFQIPVDKIVGATRKQEVAIARHVSMYLSKSLTGAPLKTIGHQFGNRDHTTVIHACRTVEKKLSNDPAFEDLVNQLQDQIVG